ncbi:MAG TPA: aminotransferase class V-fold PLP-dependent enzyme, partial [Nevskiales bacterium]|nr:aminotransferase class V-fold PLP-dependent enzyme [Nevskiales bacterium]
RNGHDRQCLAGILNVSFGGVEGEALLADLDGLSVSSGSACTSASAEPSYVLRALGRSDELAQASLRFSLGRWTTAAEVDAAVAQVSATVERLRALSPLWPATDWPAAVRRA